MILSERTTTREGAAHDNARGFDVTCSGRGGCTGAAPAPKPPRAGNIDEFGCEPQVYDNLMESKAASMGAGDAHGCARGCARARCGCGDWRRDPDDMTAPGADAWGASSWAAPLPAYPGPLKPLPCADAADREWWRLRRVSVPWSARPRRGEDEGTLEALAQAHANTIICGGCEFALVDLLSARAAARRAGRSRLAAADGCSACGAHARPGRLLAAQLRMARAVLAGERTLLARPWSAHARPVSDPLRRLVRAEAVAHARRVHAAAEALQAQRAALATVAAARRAARRAEALVRRVRTALSWMGGGDGGGGGGGARRPPAARTSEGESPSAVVAHGWALQRPSLSPTPPLLPAPSALGRSGSTPLGGGRSPLAPFTTPGPERRRIGQGRSR